jgi:hypothetical protein
MFIASATLSALLALLFGSAGLDKITGNRRQIDTAAKLEVPWHRYRLIAVPEIAASAGLLAGLAFAPLGIAAAIGLVLLMTGALLFRLRVHDAAPFLLGDGTFIALAGVAAVLRIATA